MGEKFKLRTLEIKSFRGIKNYKLNFDFSNFRFNLSGQKGKYISSYINNTTKYKTYKSITGKRDICE